MDYSSSSAAELVTAVGSSTVGMVAGSVTFWIGMGGMLLGVFAAVLIGSALLTAGRKALGF